ncbi:MAG: anhydro-N-acetylmuramic acid kinase [Bacteroidetes bacterium]|nr:MAG: anhydro-N-acetylmuramic acid kinase [Bacteroidota bacterium]
MQYRAIGIMSGSSLDGLDVAYVEFDENRGQWTYDVVAAECMPYSPHWEEALRHATALSALDYLRLHVRYGHYLGEAVNQFIARHGLEHRVQLIASHGHTSFHEPANQLTAQLGDGAAIAAVTGINVVSDLRAMDMALGGQGAPIVPMGEALLLSKYPLLLNLGGIANLTATMQAQPDGISTTIAFDICPANRVLNMFAAAQGLPYDDGGKLAATGHLRDEVLSQLNGQPYYSQPFPKSLANQFGTDTIYPVLKAANLSVPDALRTMVEHVVVQTVRSVGRVVQKMGAHQPRQVLVTGGGAANAFLIDRLTMGLQPLGVEVVVPPAQLVEFKEAMVMALLGVMRWREENTVMHSVTGAARSSIGGAVWMGQEA